VAEFEGLTHERYAGSLEFTTREIYKMILAEWDREVCPLRGMK